MGEDRGPQRSVPVTQSAEEDPVERHDDHSDDTLLGVRDPEEHRGRDDGDHRAEPAPADRFLDAGEQVAA